MGLFDLGFGRLMNPQGEATPEARRKAAKFQEMQQRPGMNPLDAAALATAPVPVVGDFMGLGADLWRYATDKESRTPVNYGLSALGMLPFIPGITAWHGSPHKFDEFKLDKIGSGEGAQAYGHGLYFAESQDTARHYSDYLTSNTGEYIPGYVYKGKKTEATPAIRAVASYMTDDRSADVVKSIAKRMNPDLASEIDNIDVGDLNIYNKAGNLYKVDIPDDKIEKMIDWDAPISKQKALKELIPDDLKAQRAFRKDPASKISDRGDTGEFMYHYLVRKLGSEDKASAYLAEKGISGIKYFDQGSRDAGKGTRNFVVFDDKIPKILERK